MSTAEKLNRVVPTDRARLNLTADAAALLLASLLCAVPRGPDGHGPLGFGSAFFAILASWLVWALGAYGLRHYDPWKAQGVLGELALTSLLVAAATSSLFLLRRVLPISDGQIHLKTFLLILWPTALVARMLGLAATAFARPGPEPVLVVGSGSFGRTTAKFLLTKPNVTLAGFLRLPSDSWSRRRLPAPLLGFTHDIDHVLMHTFVTEVWICGNATKDGPAIQHCIRSCEKFGIPFALAATSFRLGRAQPVERNSAPDGFIHFQTFQPKRVQMGVKRLFDIVASATALVALSPVLLGIALAVKFTSRGPVLFKQLRVGMYGRPFNMLKFRSMVTNAEQLKKSLGAQNEQTGPVFKMKNDPRVTRVGRFIRKYSLDELPQLLNVLRGEMAIVGPRPPVPSETAKYEPWQRRRLSVRPGLTCVWQVSGRNQITFEDWMYLDMQYIDNWSLRQDFQLILRTVPVVLTGRGAS